MDKLVTVFASNGMGVMLQGKVASALGLTAGARLDDAQVMEAIAANCRHMIRTIKTEIAKDEAR